MAHSAFRAALFSYFFVCPKHSHISGSLGDLLLHYDFLAFTAPCKLSNHLLKHLFSQIAIVFVVFLVTKLCLSLLPLHGLYLYPWDFPGKNTGVVCHFLLQGILLAQGSRTCISCTDRQVLSHWATRLSIVCMCAESLQSCPTLSDPMFCSPPGSSVHGTLQARTLEWVPCPPPGDLPDPEIKPKTLMSPALAGRFFTTSATWEAPSIY